jgi:hypothetical protein
MASSLNVAWPEPAFDPEATVLAAAFDEGLGSSSAIWERMRQARLRQSYEGDIGAAHH